MPVASSLKLPRVEAGDELSAEMWNDMVEAIERALRISITGANWHRNANGLHISIPPFKTHIFKLSERLIKGETDTAAIKQQWDGDSWENASSAEYTLNCDFSYDYYFADQIVEARLFGTKWQVMSPGYHIVRGVLDSALATNSAATVSIWKQTSGTWADTGDNISSVEAWTESLSETIASGTKVGVTQLADERWHAILQECSS